MNTPQMKLWILRPMDIMPPGNNPWEPWFDKCFGVVVRAETEEDARDIAAMAACNEGDEAWLSPLYSSCRELTARGDRGMVISDQHWA